MHPAPAVEPSKDLLPATVSRCREFLRMRLEDSIPDKISKEQARRIDESKPAPMTLTASKDVKAIDTMKVEELTLKDLLEITMQTMEAIVSGNRIDDYGTLLYGDKFDIEQMDVDVFISDMDFYRGKSSRLLSVVSNSERGFSSALATV